jgi:adenylate cyclase
VIGLLGAESEAALNAIDRALSTNPSCATALFLGAQAQALAAHGEKAKTYATRALRLSPFDSLAFEAQMALGEAALFEERYDEAASCFARSADTNPKFSTAYFCRALSLALAGRMEDAKISNERGLELEPEYKFCAHLHMRIAAPLLEQMARGASLLGLTK